MNKNDIASNLQESIKTAKLSISAVEKWFSMLAEKSNLSITQSTDIDLSQKIKTDGEEKIIEGIFDGQNMIGPNQKMYPIPSNYASKSKLIEGDKLKLTIQGNGAFMYKQIELIPRTLLVGHLILDGSQYKVLANSKEYNVLYASITFFRAKVGDKITIIVPKEKESEWAAVENILPENGEEK